MLNYTSARDVLTVETVVTIVQGQDIGFPGSKDLRYDSGVDLSSRFSASTLVLGKLDDS